MSAAPASQPVGLWLVNLVELCVATALIVGVGAGATGAAGLLACVVGAALYGVSLLSAARPGAANGLTAVGRLLGVRLRRADGAPVTTASLLIRRAPSLLFLLSIAWAFGIGALQGGEPSDLQSDAEVALRVLPAMALLALSVLTCALLIVAIRGGRNNGQPTWLQGAGDLVAVRES